MVAFDDEHGEPAECTGMADGRKPARLTGSRRKAPASVGASTRFATILNARAPPSVAMLAFRRSLWKPGENCLHQ